MSNTPVSAVRVCDTSRAHCALHQSSLHVRGPLPSSATPSSSSKLHSRDTCHSKGVVSACTLPRRCSRVHGLLSLTLWYLIPPFGALLLLSFAFSSWACLGLHLQVRCHPQTWQATRTGRSQGGGSPSMAARLPQKSPQARPVGEAGCRPSRSLAGRAVLTVHTQAVTRLPVFTPGLPRLLPPRPTPAHLPTGPASRLTASPVSLTSWPSLSLSRLGGQTIHGSPGHRMDSPRGRRQLCCCCCCP